MPCSKMLFRTEFHCRRTRHRVAAPRSHDLLHRGRSMRASMQCSKVPFRTEFNCRRTRQMLTCCLPKCLSAPSSIAKELAIEQRLLVLTIRCIQEGACVGPTKVRISHARRRARRNRRASEARLYRFLCTMHGTIVHQCRRRLRRCSTQRLSGLSVAGCAHDGSRREIRGGDESP